MKKNPFVISFGRLPVECITRDEQKERIIETFTLPPVTDQIFIITGLRGSGKTVLMSMIAEELGAYSNWIVIGLSPSEDMREDFYSELYYRLKAHKVRISADLSIPQAGVHIAVENGAPERTVQSKIEELLGIADRKKLNVLVTVDEVSKTQYMRSFAQMFQMMIGKELPLYFLGTGIPSNIEELQDVKDLTFLYRAPRIVLGPLDQTAIMHKYEQVLGVPAMTAATMSRLTKGYSFAFQALGYTYWNHMPVSDLTELMPDYDRLLSQASYTKLWKEMSGNDRKVCTAIAENDGGNVKDIRESIDMTSSLFSIYRQRLKARDLIDTDTYGKISFTLPRFAEFIRDKALMYEDN